MAFYVTNENLCVNAIEVAVVSSSSLLQIGDTKTIQLFSFFDTPPESLIIGPLVPLASKA